MYMNLSAEQARQNLTNEDVAQKLGIKRQSYERKKTTGRFLATECKRLCELFGVDFMYLLAID